MKTAATIKRLIKQPIAVGNLKCVFILAAARKGKFGDTGVVVQVCKFLRQLIINVCS